MISKSNLVKFARFVLLGVSEEAKKITSIFFVQCIIKQLLDSVFLIFRIIEVSVRVISLSLRLRLITPTSTSIILDITKTSSNNCLLTAKLVKRFLVIALNELNLLCFAYYYRRHSQCYRYTVPYDNRQTCLRDGETLKVVLCTKFCPLCDKQVIARALGQLRINFTCIFSGNFVKTLKILVKLILICPWAHAIAHTNCTTQGPIYFFWKFF